MNSSEGIRAYAAKPKLLFLAQTLPYPPDGGVHIRTYNIMCELAKAFDITSLCFYRKSLRPDEDAVRESLAGLVGVAEVEAFPIPQDNSRGRLIWDHLRSTILRRVYTRYIYESREFRRRLNVLLQERSFDLAHVDSLDLSGYLPVLKGLPVVCTHHNIESALLLRRGQNEPNPLRRSYLSFQAGLMEDEERFWAERVALNIAVSEEDASRLASIAERAETAVVPNGVDTRLFHPAGSNDGGVVFVGGSSWYPNRDAMQFFADQILPLLRAQNPGTAVTWVGRATQPIRAEYESTGIQLTGYVDDIRPYVHDAACYVVPLRVGGGTRLKILDAWAMGKTVVSTTIGCEGLDARDGENILIRDDPESFAAAITRVLADSQLRSRIGTAARRTAERFYDWRVIGRHMIDKYRALL